MNVIWTGAPGFIAQHVVRALLRRGHSVTAVGRNADRASALRWPPSAKFVRCDIHQSDLELPKVLGPADAVMHLAWPGLPNYKALYHFEETLLADYRFLKSLVNTGYRHLMVTGTCLEYGMRSGALREEMETQPCVPYGLATDTLRRCLEISPLHQDYAMQWTLLLYTIV